VVVVKPAAVVLRLRGPADIAMMQATDFGNLHDPVRLGELHCSAVWRVFIEREMRASPVIVRNVAGQHAAQMRFAEDQNVIHHRGLDRVATP